jgi:hypothetical protein
LVDTVVRDVVSELVVAGVEEEAAPGRGRGLASLERDQSLPSGQRQVIQRRLVRLRAGAGTYPVPVSLDEGLDVPDVRGLVNRFPRGRGAGHHQRETEVGSQDDYHQVPRRHPHAATLYR